jgi:Predicted nucleotide-binding protein containing TIR-like domain
MLQREATTFIHYFDSRFSAARGVSFQRPEVWEEARLAFRLALLTSDRIIIPATSWFEEPGCRQLLRQHAAFFDDGRIELVGTAEGVDEFCALQAEQYASGSARHLLYRGTAPLARSMPPFYSRRSHPRDDLLQAWGAALRDGRADAVARRLDLRDSRRRWRRQWAAVPDALEGRAFVAEFISPILSPRTSEVRADAALQSLITPAFFGGFRRAFGARTVVNLVWLGGGQHDQSGVSGLDYRRSRLRLKELGLLKPMLHLDQGALRRAEESGIFDVALFGSRRRRAANVPDLAPILIVHGRGPRRYELAEFLRSLGMESTRLEQQRDAGQVVIEKFEAIAPTVERAIVIVEPDDVGRLRTPNSADQLRARQNVVFELGWLMGHFGRKSGRIIVIEDVSKGEIDWLSDLSGLLRIRVESSIEGVGEQLRRELSLI